MIWTKAFGAAGTLATCCAMLAFSQNVADSAKVERGRYLVEDVAKCQDCHTPRSETGELDKSHTGTLGNPRLTGRVALREGGTVFLGGITYQLESGAVETPPSRPSGSRRDKIVMRSSV